MRYSAGAAGDGDEVVFRRRRALLALENDNVPAKRPRPHPAWADSARSVSRGVPFPPSCPREGGIPELGPHTAPARYAGPRGMPARYGPSQRTPILSVNERLAATFQRRSRFRVDHRPHSPSPNTASSCMSSSLHMICGFRVRGSGFGVWGVGCGVWGLGFRV